MRRRTSIAAIVILIIVTMTLIIMSVAGMIGYSIFKKQEIAELRLLSLALVDQASTGLALPMWNMDETQIHKATESVMKVRTVRAVVVRNPDGMERILVLERDSAGDPVATKNVAPREGDFASEKDVSFSGEVLGSVQVVVAPTELEERLRSIRIALCFTILGLVVLLSATLYFLIWWIILHPIKLLEQFALQVDAERFDGVRFPSTRFFGELDSLRTSMGKMVAMLDARYRALQLEVKRFRESEERFRTLVNTIPDLIWLKNADGVYLACNRMFERFFGATESEIVGKTDFDFVDDDLADLFLRNDQKAIEVGGPSSNEEWVVFADDGHRALLDTTKTPMFGGDGELIGVLGIGRDITQRTQAEEERRQLAERVNNMRKLEALGVLVAGVAHNINNVLAAIMGTASLRSELAADPSDRESFGVVVTACRRGRDVVKSLMQFSKPTLSSQEPIELHALLAEVRVLLDNTTRNRIRIVEEFLEEPLWIHGDVGSISNAFMNLCLNSIDAMPDGGVITFRSEAPEEGWVQVSVEDTGEGMDPDVLERVMDPFFTTKEVGKGTGLGLSMTHGVIKAHGGSLEIVSQRGKGAVVKVRFPRVASPVQDRPVVTVKPFHGPMNILVVDDDPDVRFLVARMLKSKGVNASVVAGGQEALDYLDSNDSPDLVIMDQNMPGMDGVEAMARIRSRHPALPILISSGQLDIEEWECFRQPNVGVISKPFDMSELMAKLAQFEKESG